MHNHVTLAMDIKTMDYHTLEISTIICSCFGHLQVTCCGYLETDVSALEIYIICVSVVEMYDGVVFYYMRQTWRMTPQCQV